MITVGVMTCDMQTYCVWFPKEFWVTVVLPYLLTLWYTACLACVTPREV